MEKLQLNALTRQSVTFIVGARYSETTTYLHYYSSRTTSGRGRSHGQRPTNYLQQDLADREWPTPCTKSLVIALPKKGNVQLWQNYRTISLISHPSKVMLKIILNRMKPEAEKIIAEEQAGFRPGRSTTEQIFNLRILCERYLQHTTGSLSCLR